MASNVATSTVSAPASSVTIEAFLCDNCRCPIGSVWDVLPADAHAPAWRDHVYSYELDLFANGAPPIQAYSATNPSKRRFDLLRLAPHVTLRGQSDNDSNNNNDDDDDASATNAQSAAGAASLEVVSPTTVTHAPSFVACDTAVYSTEHSFFTGYAWCFCHCSNCGAFLGWGFAAEERLRSAEREAAPPVYAPRRRVDRAGGDDGSDDDDDADVDDAASTAAGVAPDFIGVIITHCTGDPSYPIDALRREVAWQPWRLQRRKRVQAITRELRQLLLADPDGFHAHRIYYTFESIVGRMFLTPPATAHPVVGQDDVPPQLMDVLEVARASVARQREPRSTHEQPSSSAESTDDDHDHRSSDDNEDGTASTAEDL